MAAQNPHPGTWFNRLSDGCTGVFNFKWVNPGILRACRIHDCDMWWGGKTAKEKLRADKALCTNTAKAGWLGRLIASGRFYGVRALTWNTPPQINLGVKEKRYATMWEAIKHGQWKIEVWNWEGPGRGRHANMEAQGSKDFLQLLPEQMPEVAAAPSIAIK